MKKTLVFAALVLCASPAWALRFMGPPTPKSEAGQLGLGFDWSYSEFDIRSDDASIRPKPKLENEVYFARLLLGVTDWAEISASVGISDVEQDAAQGFQSGNDFAWGVGSKLRFWESGPVDLGAAFQLSSFRADDGDGTGPYLTEGKFDTYVMELAVGPSYETHGICVYGGPFVHFITGDLEGKSAGSRTEIDIEEEDPEFGGYVGASAEILEDTSVSLEYHFTNDSYAIGAGIIHRFGVSRKTPSDTNTRIYNPWPTPPKKEPTPAGEDLPKERLKTDESGKPVKDENGNFVFVPVTENEEK